MRANGYNQAVQSGKVYSFWNPFDAQKRSYNQANYIHHVDSSTFFTDISNNNLPQVSYVIPTVYTSEHAPSSVVVGKVWVTKVVDSIMNSPYWQNTVIIVSGMNSEGFMIMLYHLQSITMVQA
jgi:phospholipase C